MFRRVRSDRGFNARGYWQALSPPQQRCIGELAVLVTFADMAADVSTLTEAELRRWRHCLATARVLLAAAMPQARCARIPDIAALHIRACRVCGCTELSACEGGCSWIEN